MRVYVRKEDIEFGKRGSPHACPLALALGRVFPDEVVGVGLTMVHIGSRIYAVGAAGRWFIRMFDAGMPTRPQMVSIT